MTGRVLRARGAVLALLLVVGVSVLPSGATAAPAPHKPLSGSIHTPLGGKDLPRLTAELAAVTAHAQLLGAKLDEAASRDGGLRLAYSRLEDARNTAQAVLNTRARQVYMASAPSPVGNWQADFAAPELREFALRGARAALTVDQELVDAVTARAATLKTLQRQADAFRASLLVQAQAVLADQDRARMLLAQAQAIAIAEQAVAVQRELESQRLLLDDVSARVTIALTPAQSRRSQRAFQTQAPVVALLEAAGSAIPAGYVRTGHVVSGTASWYGPGFVGRPTASGSPYNPEKPTCAHKTLPLGTVLHVTSGALSTNCLVNDRGPYVGDRILDMSRAGSRALGYSGLAAITFEVIAPG